MLNTDKLTTFITALQEITQDKEVTLIVTPKIFAQFSQTIRLSNDEHPEAIQYTAGTNGTGNSYSDTLYIHYNNTTVAISTMPKPLGK